ncbi:hypothetical protein HYV91_01905 [Candidatus Wolfebacteria bacterium]|nr:hypothetical protein [Candidatus Wolfebacteria bacterium]
MDSILKQNIIQDLGIDRLPADEQEEALLSIGRIIFQGVLIRVMGLLGEKDKDEFDKLLTEKADDEEAVLKFLQAKLPNLDEIVNNEIAMFKRESLDFMQALK